MKRRWLGNHAAVAGGTGEGIETDCPQAESAYDARFVNSSGRWIVMSVPLKIVFTTSPHTG